MAYKKREELLDYIEVIENHIKVLEQENEELKQRIIDLDGSKGVRKLKNERNAGRKSKFSLEDIKRIKTLYRNGNSIRTIASVMHCSVGLVHRIVNE